MAHFALLDENNIVQRVEVVHNDIATDEAAGIALLHSLYGGGNFKQTSYNASIRKNYAGVGYTYDVNRDAFIPPKPYQSWILNDQTCLWESPVKYPTDGKDYIWDETMQVWAQL